MRSHRQSQFSYHTKVWQKYINDYPAKPPQEGFFEDTYSNDLVDSRSSWIYNQAGKGRNLGSGGNFEVIKRTYRESSTHPPGQILLYASNGTQGRAVLDHQRAAYAAITNDVFPIPARSSDAQMRAWGRLGIQRTTPTTSEVDLSSMLGELISEGLPSMIGLASRRSGDVGPAKRAANENLNYEFGVKPLLNDVQSAVDAFRRSKQIWDQYVANAGKVLRRRYDFPGETVVTRVQDTSNPAPYGHRFLYSGSSHPRVTVTTRETRRWFVGHYQYAIPQDPFARNLSRWNKLYGVMPDVETLWNLAPWSWAFDWVGDLGTSVSNIAALQADGLVLLSGHMMEYTSTEVEIYLGPVKYSNVSGNPAPAYFMQSFKSERKRRVVASPYGFHLDWDGFSPRQIGILASLGITRGRRK